MSHCTDKYDSTTRQWLSCSVCGRPRSPKARCNLQLCRVPSKRNCESSAVFPSTATQEDIAEARAKATAAAQHHAHLSQHGPGAHLHKLIKAWTGEGITAACGCENRIAEMNARGPGWCRDNVDKIVDWLIEEVDRRLKQAKDEGKSAGWRLRLGGISLPGRRLVLRRLVLLAVRRAEREVSFPRGRKHLPIISL